LNIPPNLLDVVVEEGGDFTVNDDEDEVAVEDAKGLFTATAEEEEEELLSSGILDDGFLEGGKARATLLASNSTNTASGLISRTSCPATSALFDEIWAEPNIYMSRLLE
jgi:hypothetical protein